MHAKGGVTVVDTNPHRCPLAITQKGLSCPYPPGSVVGAKPTAGMLFPNTVVFGVTIDIPICPIAFGGLLPYVPIHIEDLYFHSPLFAPQGKD